jgi:hypothetical protein
MTQTASGQTGVSNLKAAVQCIIAAQSDRRSNDDSVAGVGSGMRIAIFPSR